MVRVKFVPTKASKAKASKAKKYKPLKCIVKPKAETVPPRVMEPMAPMGKVAITNKLRSAFEPAKRRVYKPAIKINWAYKTEPAKAVEVKDIDETEEEIDETEEE